MTTLLNTGFATSLANVPLQRFGECVGRFTMSSVMALMAASPFVVSETHAAGLMSTRAMPFAAGATAQDADYSVAIRLADAAERAGDKVSAIRFLAEAIANGEGGTGAWERRGRLLLDMKVPDAAAANFRLALDRGHDSVLIRRGYGTALVRLGQPEAALKEYDRAISRDRKDHRAMNGRGVVLDMLERHEEAQKQYQKALALSPGDLSVQNNMALSYALSGGFSDAVRILEGIEASGVADARHRQNLALLYGLMGRTRDAASLGMQDLDQGDVKQNLALYATLRERYQAYQAATGPAPQMPEIAQMAPPQQVVPPQRVAVDVAPAVPATSVPAKPVDLPDQAVGGSTGPSAGSAQIAMTEKTVESVVDRIADDAVASVEAESTVLSDQATIVSSEDREQVVLAAPSWTLDLGTHESASRASQTWLRLKTRLPSLFDGVSYSVESDGGENRLLAGADLSPEVAQSICSDVAGIGYSCSVTVPDNNASMTMASSEARQERAEEVKDVPAAVAAPVAQAAPLVEEVTEAPVVDSAEAPIQQDQQDAPRVLAVPVGSAVTSTDVAALAGDTSDQAAEKVLAAPVGVAETDKSTSISVPVEQLGDDAGDPAQAVKPIEATADEVNEVNPPDDVLSVPPGSDTASVMISADADDGGQDVGAVKGVPVLEASSERTTPAVQSSTPSSAEDAPAMSRASAAVPARSDQADQINSWGVDLGTFETQQEADVTWLRLRTREQTLFAGLSRRTENRDEGVRLMAGAVRSREQADEICRAISTAGCVARKF